MAFYTFSAFLHPQNYTFSTNLPYKKHTFSVFLALKKHTFPKNVTNQHFAYTLVIR